MSGTVVFQVGSLATPGPGIVVGQDDVGGTAWQYVKLDVGPAGTSRPVSYAGGTGIPVAGVGTFQTLGSIQGVGTFQVLGSVQTVGTSQVLGSIQGVGTFQVLGSVQSVGTNQALGTFQPLAGSVHIASTGTIPLGTVQVLGSVQAVGTTQTQGVRTVANPGITRVPAQTTNLILLASNANRLGASFYNESGSALFLKHGSLSGTFDYTMQVTAGALYELPFGYSGTVSGIWQFASGTLQITETT